MIVVEFLRDGEDNLKGFSIKGHANDADYGESIVCAAVSALAQSCVNGLSEIARAEIVRLEIEYGDMFVEISTNSAQIRNDAQVLLKSLLLGIRVISEDNPKHVRLI